MRFFIADKKYRIYPEDGKRRYINWFAWRPVIAEGVAGPHGWPRHIIWLERVREEQVYRWYLFGGHGWTHDSWMPRTEFTLKLR